MKIKNYKCKCGSDDFFMSSLKDKPTGIYCSRCGKWLKWADKDERNLTLKRIDDIDDTPTIEIPKWIPVSERLPEKNVEVLVTTEWDCITIGEMFSNNDWFIHEGATNAGIDDIKAWMPLPEPYKENT